MMPGLSKAFQRQRSRLRHRVSPQATCQPDGVPFTSRMDKFMLSVTARGIECSNSIACHTWCGNARSPIKAKRNANDPTQSNGYSGGRVSHANHLDDSARTGEAPDGHVGEHSNPFLWADEHAQQLLETSGCGDVKRVSGHDAH